MNNINLEDIKKYSILSWIKFDEYTSVLCVNIDECVVKILKLKNPSVKYDCYKTNTYHCDFKSYDYILAFHIFEKENESTLDTLFNLLSDDGIMYLGSENASAMAYECGMSSIYSKIYKKEYINNKLIERNYIVNAVYTVLPSLQETQLIINHNYMINESISTRYVPTNKDNFNRIVNEGKNYESINERNEFHNKANAYLFELAKTEKKSNILQVTLSPDRGVDKFCMTIVYEDKVEKEYPFKENLSLLENNNYLSKHNINLVDLSYKDGIYTMPYIKNENCLLFFKRTLEENPKAFVRMCDKYYDVIQKSSKVVETSELGNILEKCFFDLVPLNCFVINNEFVFFDQEFCIENYPADLIMWRTLYMIYNNIKEDVTPSRQEMYKRYGIDKNESLLIKMSNNFLANLRNFNK